MDRLKKARTPVRASITRTSNEVEAELIKPEPGKDVLEFKLHKLENLLEEINDLDQKVKDMMLDENQSEDDYAQETSRMEEFTDKIGVARLKIQKIIHPTGVSISPSASLYSTADGGENKKFKLPKIEFPKFSGEIKDWLNWWGQFKKIHDDKQIEDGDKFHFLTQSVTAGSKAATAIANFPVTAENYPKAIDILQKQFGDSKVLWKYYMRDLTALIQNGPNRGKVSLFSLYHKLESQLRALESLGNVTRDDFLCPLVESSLPSETLVAWQRSSNYGIDGSKANPPKSELDYLQSEDDVPTIAALHVAANARSCLFCGKTSHETKDCGRTKQLSIKEKEEKLMEGKACLLCFKPGHFARKCKSFVKCLVCEKKHQTVMCPKIHEQQEGHPVQSAINLSINKGVMLETLLVKLVGADNKVLKARIFLDRGAMRSFIKKSTAEMMGYQPVGSQIFGKTLLGGVNIERKSYNVYQVKIRDLKGKVSKILQLTEQEPFICQLPTIPDGPWIQELKQNKISLSDFGRDDTTGIDILIGADQMSQILTKKVLHLKCGLTATETVFGWVIMGPLQRDETIGSILCSHVKDENVSKLWDLETLGIRDTIETETEAEKEEEAKKSFAKNLKRAPDGRYSVGLPWVNQLQEIPSNKYVAEMRTINMTKGLISKDKFNQYNEVLKTWLAEGLIEKAADNDKSNKCHYLPHRPVFNEKSLTTPCRPVFNASCKVGRNPSLNECLYTGQNKIVFLPSVLMRFREKRIGVIFDIRKAFMMIAINEEDRNFLRFFWWEDERMEKLAIVRHCRVLFGVNSSPFLLAATIEHHLNSYQNQLKNIATKLLNSLYIDNSVTSVESYEEYEDFRANSTKMILEAGMDLRLWECSRRTEDDKKTEQANVLGIIWDKMEDTLKCDIPVKPEIITKRKILSILHQVFDPIGQLCPSLLQPKMLLQKAWIQKCEWDDKNLPEEITTAFGKWVDELPSLAEIKVPRQACYTENTSARQIHMFCDASRDAYAAAIFIRSETPEGVKVQLIHAKNRVAPLKKATIPRLELLGCWMGANLTKTVKEALGDSLTFYWTDSSTALAWIKRNDHWGTFVGNRVKKIIELSSVESWRHIPGIHNPCSPTELLASRWWEGPAWLKEPIEKWPSSLPLYDETEIQQELRKTPPEVISTQVDKFEPRFSVYSKNVRVYGWIRRFINACRSKKNNSRKTADLEPLSIQEMRLAELDLIYEIQQQTMPVNSKIVWGLPVEKTERLYRVTTKLTHVKEEWNFKRPILLPKNNPLVVQLVEELHRTYCHAGVQYLMGKLREKFWIPQARRTIRSILHKCVTCRRWDAKKTEVDPAALPEKRVTISEAFETKGVDLAGPLYLKDGTKIWIVLYTCAVYRCVHLDLVDSLSTEAFLRSLERFIYSEGRPNTIFSDNGTNFVGAANLLKTLDWNVLKEEMNVKSISWTFNPPTAAWWGGWWERLVRTVNDLLRRTLGSAKLTFDEMRTSLAAVTHTINGRPLATVTEDFDDLVPLTPSMFLRGLPMQGFPENEYISPSNLQKNYKKMNSLKKQFQIRFRNEYLAQLVHQSKLRPC
ncbi:uncharacterized protein LOC110860286 [Folsomia candida]|uniref:uncharacterized protein LOC110860286 n=1 Tax=Folsomia candida TaxID=158441 RepID=UPI000B8FC4E2|nr:uncharacterized protein LOC110860286 [Folsomia candida]